MKNNKHLRNLICAVSVLLVLVIVIGAVVVFDKLNSRVSEEISVEQAQQLLDKTFDGLPNNVAGAAKYLRQNSSVTVDALEYGDDKNIILHCSYNTVKVYDVIKENINDILNIELKKPNGKPKSGTEIQLELQDSLIALFESAPKTSGEIDITVYETKDKGLVVYLDDPTVDTVFGGIKSAHELVRNTMSIEVGGETIDLTSNNTLRNGCIQAFALVNYSAAKPDTSTAIQRFWNDLSDEFYRNFIKDNRWTYLLSGLGTTLSITALSLVLGILLGFIVAIIRCTYAKTGKLRLLDAISRLYVTIMRGTPVMVQLMIIYFVILLPIGIEKFTAAVLCFGINSGAYVSEIVRGGIMSVDEGQNEAGRSLGLGYVATMWYIIIPQAIKAILPALANEFIALLKETSIAFYIGVADLTQGGLKIRSITYSNFMPLIAIALIYLILVLGLSYLVSLLERRLRKSDRS